MMCHVTAAQLTRGPTEQCPIGEWDHDYKEGSDGDEPGQREGYECDGARKGGGLSKRCYLVRMI